jgi:hypothetical protein
VDVHVSTFVTRIWTKLVTNSCSELIGMADIEENAARSTNATKMNAVVPSMRRRSALPVAAAAEAASTPSNLALTRRALNTPTTANATTMRSSTATSQNNCTDKMEPASITSSLSEASNFASIFTENLAF